MYLNQQKLLLVFCLCVYAMLFQYSPFVYAKSEEYATVASPVEIEGEANDHDIISYGIEQNIYKPSRAFADESMFGVIVDDPVLYMDSEVARSEKVRPVVRYGEVTVNVSTLGGDIVAGDLITTSPIAGIGQKTFRQDAPYILGFALEPMTLNGGKLEIDGKEVLLGTVPITLRIGPYLTKEGADFVASGGKGFETLISEITNTAGMNSEKTSDSQEISAFKVFRYLLAAIIAVASMVVSASRFGDTFKESVVSIGRNPLARTQIRSILMWNILLMILVSGAGLGVAAAIILLP
jgi:hypothetical protein